MAWLGRYVCGVVKYALLVVLSASLGVLAATLMSAIMVVIIAMGPVVIDMLMQPEELWLQLTGRPYEGCKEIVVSGQRYCLPRNRVRLWRWGPHGALMFYYLTPLPEGKEGERVLFSLANGYVRDSVPREMTIPEYHLRNISRAQTNSEQEGERLWARVRQRIAEARDGDIVDLSDLLMRRPQDRPIYMQVRNGRVVRWIRCDPPNEYYRQMCSFVSHFPHEELFLRYDWRGQQTDRMVFIHTALKMEADFRQLLAHSRRLSEER